jgi:hypothetical protein
VREGRRAKGRAASGGKLQSVGENDDTLTEGGDPPIALEGAAPCECTAPPEGRDCCAVGRGGFVCRDPGVIGGGGFVGQDPRRGLCQGPLGREVPPVGGVQPRRRGLGVGAGWAKGAGRLPTHQPGWLEVAVSLDEVRG